MIPSAVIRFFVGACISAGALCAMSLGWAVLYAHADDEATSTVATSTDGTGGISGAGGIVETSTSTATTTVTNELNSNTANPDAPGSTNSSNITSTTTNIADLANIDETNASSGENEADGGSGLAAIATGAAIAAANVINIINTNIFNSNGLLLFLNQLFGGGFDLSEYDLSYFFGEDVATPECTILSCLNSSSLNVLNTNTATVTNSVLVRASTGQNAATSSGDGSATITTGDSYAAANVLNLVNTNVINSHYLLVSFNNFGSLGQDITLPDASFFAKLFAQGGLTPSLNSSTYTVNNTNDAAFTGTTTADALTGDNVASSTATSTASVTTGNAYTSASTFNQINQNNVGGTSVFLLFRVWGSWTGNIQGLPSGIEWAQTPDGIALVSTDSSTTPAETLGSYNSSSFLASSTNTSNIANTIHVYALTGENEATTENGTSTITTGNAYAAANVVNLVNTNVIGRNWIFAIFNIFGDWSGNINFGKPDLWVGTVAQTPNPTPPGTFVTYTFTIANRGAVDAGNVILKLDFDKSSLSFEDQAATPTDTGVEWNVGTIARGASRDFTYQGYVYPLPSDMRVRTIPVRAEVSSAAPDADPSDNTDAVTIVAGDPSAVNSGGGGGGGIGNGAIVNTSLSIAWTPDPKISMTNVADASTTTAPATVNYTIDLTNETAAGPAFYGTLTDTLYDATGSVMYSNSWDLDTVAPGDEIKLTFSIAYATNTAPGVYHNVARVTAKKNYHSMSAGVDMTPVEATSDVVFDEDGIVHAHASSTSQAAAECSTPLISSNIVLGKRNNQADVLALQAFLNSFVDKKLPLTGYYGPLTSRAVSTFQLLFSKEILVPSGVKSPTGSVYQFTKNKINSFACANSFALTPAQLNQIARIQKTRSVAARQLTSATFSSR